MLVAFGAVRQQLRAPACFCLVWWISVAALRLL